MDFSKIKQSHVWGVGAGLIVITGVLIYFLFVRAVQADADSAKAWDEKQKGIAQTLPQVQNDNRTAETNLQTATVQNGGFVNRNPRPPLFPDIETDPNSRWKGLMSQQDLVLGTHGRLSLGRQLVRFFTRRWPDLTANAVFQIPFPPATPSAAFAQNPLLFQNAGTVTVDGTYQAIQRYLETLKNAPRLVVIHELALDATAAALTPGRQNWVHGAFTVDVYEFVPGVPIGGAGGGGATTGGMGGGMAGGMGGGYPTGGGGGMGAGGMGGGYPTGGGGGAKSAAAATGGTAGVAAAGPQKAGV